MPDLKAALANPENRALPPIDIRDVLDTEVPDMSGINLRNLLPSRREEGTTEDVSASSRPARRKRVRTEGSAGLSRLSTSTSPSPSVLESHEVAPDAIQPGNSVRPGVVLRSGLRTTGEGSVPLWAPQMEYRGEGAVTEEDCILPVNEVRSGSAASALSQVVRLPLDMNEWKKATDEGLINDLRRGLLMVSD